MKAKILKTEADYEAALAYVDTLMDAEPGSPAEADLELFAMLIAQYEREHHPIAPPDPVDAILFRMEQQGLTRSDLVTFIGSQSKVSEVLNRKRPLSLSMIRRLHTGLGIPADVLLQEPGRQLESPRFATADFPIKEMVRYGYFGESARSVHTAKEHAEEYLATLFAVFEGNTPRVVYCRRLRNGNGVNVNALTAWQARVLTLIQDATLPIYTPSQLDDVFFKKLARASYFPSGPQLVKDLLNQKGIHFVVLPHLPQTYLDGAAFMTLTGHPVVALTLRHNRLDNFWFTLAHEIAHIHLHLHEDNVAFFDDTEQPIGERDPREVEADAFAQQILLPTWTEIRDPLLTAKDEAILALADELEIAPAILAGRIRWETGDFGRHTRLIGQGEVRPFFGRSG